MPPAHLNKILAVELDWLDEEVSIPNPQASYDYVLGSVPEVLAWARPMQVHWLSCIKRRTGLCELYWDELGEDISVRSDQDCPAAAPVLD